MLICENILNLSRLVLDLVRCLCLSTVRNILVLGVTIETKKMSSLMYGYPLSFDLSFMFLNFDRAAICVWYSFVHVVRSRD